MRKTNIAMAVGLVLGTLLGSLPTVLVTPLAPMTLQAATALQVSNAKPTDKLAWTWTQSTSVPSLADANAYRITAYVGANADKALANPLDSTIGAGTAVTFTCVQTAPTPTTVGYSCTSNQTLSQIVGSTAFGSYKVTLLGERRKADGTYAPKAVATTGQCQFQFSDDAPSAGPENVRVLAA